jgi:hypothetical protein
MATVRQIVDKAIALVGEVAGAGVAMYSEDLMRDNAIRAFDMLFTKYNWDEFIEWTQFNLDGVLGFAPAGTFDFVRNFEDFLGFYKNNNTYQIPMLNKSTNPYSLNGLQAQFWSSLPAKSPDFNDRRIQFWPKASTGLITAALKVYPIDPAIDWDWGDDMILDPALLTHGVAYVSLANDETNAGAADMQRGLMEDRYADIMAKLADRPIVTHTRHG